MLSRDDGDKTGNGLYTLFTIATLVQSGSYKILEIILITRLVHVI